MNNQPLIYMPPTDPRAKDVAPAYLRTSEFEKDISSPKGSASSSTGSIYFPPIPGIVDVPLSTELQKLLPGLSDIEIIEEVIDRTVTPATTYLVFRVKNSTGYPVIGLKGRVEKIV